MLIITSAISLFIDLIYLFALLLFTASQYQHCPAKIFHQCGIKFFFLQNLPALIHSSTFLSLSTQSKMPHGFLADIKTF